MTTRRVIALAMTLAVVSSVNVSSTTPARAEGDITIGGQWWDQNHRDAKYDEFIQVPRGGFLENYLLREWSGRNYLALWGANAIQKDQANKLTWANGVRWRADLGYSQIPHTFSHLARSAWVQASPGFFALPDQLQTANQTTPANYTTNMRDVLANS